MIPTIMEHTRGTIQLAEFGGLVFTSSNTSAGVTKTLISRSVKDIGGVKLSETRGGCASSIGSFRRSPVPSGLPAIYSSRMISRKLNNHRLKVKPCCENLTSRRKTVLLSLND